MRVVCGKGNNGGDGLVVARLLREEGREVDVLAVGDLTDTKGDARIHLDRLPGDPPRSFAALSCGSGVIVDAMLGTGFEGEPRDPVAGAIAAINEADAPVVACDVPSGVDASTGEAQAAPCARTRPRRSTAPRSGSTSIRARSTPAGSRSSRSGSRAMPRGPRGRG